MIMKIVQKCRQGRKAQPINRPQKGRTNRILAVVSLGVAMLFQTVSATSIKFDENSVGKWYRLSDLEDLKRVRTGGGDNGPVSYHLGLEIDTHQFLLVTGFQEEIMVSSLYPSNVQKLVPAQVMFIIPASKPIKIVRVNAKDLGVKCTPAVDQETFDKLLSNPTASSKFAEKITDINVSELEKVMVNFGACSSLASFLGTYGNEAAFTKDTQWEEWKACKTLLEYNANGKNNIKFKIGDWVEAESKSGCTSEYYSKGAIGRVVNIKIKDRTLRQRKCAFFGFVITWYHPKKTVTHEGTFYTVTKNSYATTTVPRRKWNNLKFVDPGTVTCNFPAMKNTRRRLLPMERLLKEIERAQHTA